MDVRRRRGRGLYFRDHWVWGPNHAVSESVQLYGVSDADYLHHVWADLVYGWYLFYFVEDVSPAPLASSSM